MAPTIAGVIALAHNIAAPSVPTSAIVVTCAAALVGLALGCLTAWPFERAPARDATPVTHLDSSRRPRPRPAHARPQKRITSPASPTPAQRSILSLRCRSRGCSVVRRYAVRTLVLAGLMLGTGATTAGAATDAFLVLGSVDGTPQHQCTDVTCSTQVVGYDYTGTGLCQGACLGWPVGDAQTMLNFNATKGVSSNPCKIKSGAGTLDLQWPPGPTVPEIQGSFSFKARDSKTLSFQGVVTSSNLAVVPVGTAVSGTVGFPPSPCEGGLAAFQLSFGP